MREFALVAAAVAALAVVVLVVRLLFLVRRVQRVWERIDQTVEHDLRPAIRDWGEAGREMHRAAGTLNQGLTDLSKVAGRVEDITAKLEPGMLVGSTMTKLSSWLSGVRRGIARHHPHPHPRTGQAETGSEEGEPND